MAAASASARFAEDSVDEVPDSEEEELVLESDNSGSEYEVSDIDDALNGEDSDNSADDYAEPAVVDEYTEQGVDDEDVMMDAAIQASLDSARLDNGCNAGMSSAGAGSSRQHPPVNSAAALRAAAAERRLAKELQDDDASIAEISSGSEVSLSEDEQPLAKGKGKGKAKVSATMLKLIDTSEGKIMTAAERRRERQLRRQEQSVLKMAERRLRTQLGRKLTYVSIAACSWYHPLTIVLRRRSPLSLFNFTTQS